MVSLDAGRFFLTQWFATPCDDLLGGGWPEFVNETPVFPDDGEKIASEFLWKPL